MGRKKFDFDYVVIGSGVAGMAAATTAAGFGAKVAIVEGDSWGGASVNYNDTPQATSLSFSHLYSRALEGAKFGLSSTNLRYNFPTAMSWQMDAIRNARKKIEERCKELNITRIEGFGHFVGAHDLAVGDKKVSGEKFMVATGVKMADNGITGLNEVEYLTASSAMKINRLPKAVMVVGAGASGCETAQYFAELGVKVLIADLAARLLPKEDEEVGQTLDAYFTKQLGIKVLTQTRVVAIEQDRLSKRVVFMRDGQEKMVRVDAIVMTTGTSPMVDLGLENAGVKYGVDGVRVNKCLGTSAKHIVAAGSVLGKDGAIEKATYEGVLATTNLLKKAKNEVNYSGYARVTNTDPQIATVGMTEDDCIKSDMKYSKVLIPAGESNLSNIEGCEVGFVKLIAKKQKQKQVLLGATVMLPNASMVVQELSLAIKCGIDLAELASTPHVALSWGELVRMGAKKLL